MLLVALLCVFCFIRRARRRSSRAVTLHRTDGVAMLTEAVGLAPQQAIASARMVPEMRHSSIGQTGGPVSPQIISIGQETASLHSDRRYSLEERPLSITSDMPKHSTHSTCGTILQGGWRKEKRQPLLPPLRAITTSEDTAIPVDGFPPVARSTPPFLSTSNTRDTAGLSTPRPLPIPPNTTREAVSGVNSGQITFVGDDGERKNDNVLLHQMSLLQAEVNRLRARMISSHRAGINLDSASASTRSMPPAYD